MGGPCSTNGEKRKVYRLLMGKPEGKRPLGRWRHRWVDNIRMDLGEVGWGDVDWIGLAKDRNRWTTLVNSVLNLRVPWNAGKLSSGLTSSGLSSSVQLHRVSSLFPLQIMNMATAQNMKIISVNFHLVQIYEASSSSFPYCKCRERIWQ
jgi:hypothetical protein